MRINILYKLVVLVSVFCFQFYLSAQEISKSDAVKIDTSWKYLGRPRPGMTPLRFPPDSLLANSNWFYHGSPTFSPDFKEMYWGKYTIYPTYQRVELAFIKYLDNQWTSMQAAPFANLNYSNNNPFFSGTGDTLFFYSSAPEGFILRVTRTTSGWTQPSVVPIPLPQGYGVGLQFSMSKNGTLYLELSDQNLQHGIYKSVLVNGNYQMPVSLGPLINTNTSEFGPYIDPDERFLIFASSRPGGYGYHDLYLSTRNSNNTWNAPINLGSTINTSSADAYPYITPDGLYFFYTTEKQGDLGYNPYWISAQYIYNLASVGINNQSGNVKDFELFQNYPNPFNPSTKIRFQIKESGFVSLKVYDILGKEVAVLMNEKLQPGSYEIPFSINEYNENHISSGIYFYSLETENYRSTKKMIFMK
jgi:hypothetical protein